jgi:hypothetical protein
VLEHVQAIRYVTPLREGGSLPGIPEADHEVQDLLTASVGLNLGVDFLPGSFGYAGSQPPSPQEASRVLWLDAFTANVDRTWRNPNLLVWHGQMWAIDHGTALYFLHSWPNRGSDPARFAGQAFDASMHVLLDVADDLAPIHDDLAGKVDSALLDSVLAEVPDEWLPHEQPRGELQRLLAHLVG